MLFLVSCVYDEGLYEENFCVVEAPSRLAVAQHIVDDPWQWKDFLDRAYLFDPIARGNAPYYADPEPVTAEEALELIDASHVDGDSIAQFAILPIGEILRLPLPETSEVPAANIKRPAERP